MNKKCFGDLIAFHPGYYLKDVIGEIEINQREFAKRLGITEKTLSLLLVGNADITIELAGKLSTMLGTSIDLWLNLQKKYDEKKAMIMESKRLESENIFLKQIDYMYFVKNGFVKNTKERKSKIEQICSTLGIASLSILTNVDLKKFACKSALNVLDEKNIMNLNAWLLLAENQGRKIQNLPRFSGKKLNSHINELRDLNTYNKPADFLPRIKEIFQESGVRFVLIPHLKNSGINGLVKWNGESPLLAMNDRNLTSDRFWFVLFHEIKHLLQGKRKESIVDFDIQTAKGISLKQQDFEIEADEYSQNLLIPLSRYHDFVSKQDFSKANIISFSREINVNPSILVGRLQHDGKIPYTYFHDLKIPYKIR